MDLRKAAGMSDRKLIRSIANDDEAAFSRLFDKYWKSLSNSAFKVLKDRDVAHDIVQDIFTSLWMKRKSLMVDHVASYLHSAVKYRVINYIQKHKIPMMSLDFVDGFKNINATEEVLNLKQLDELLKASIDELPEQCKKVFRMSRFEDMSNKEIAQHLNLSVRTVENHIAHAIRLLRPKVNSTLLLLLLTYHHLHPACA